MKNDLEPRGWRMPFTRRPSGRHRSIAFLFVSTVAMSALQIAAAAAPLDTRDAHPNTQLPPLSQENGRAAKPLDPICAVGGIDDRCEEWAAIFSPPNVPGEDGACVVEAYGVLWRDHNIVPSKMVVSPAGDRVFTMCSPKPDVQGNRVGTLIVAHNATDGEESWRLTASAVDIAVSADGRRLYVVSPARISVDERPGDWQPLFNYAAITTAYDAMNGELLWSRTFSTAPVGHREGDPHDLHSYDLPSAVIASPTADELYVAGFTDSRDGHRDIFVVGYEGATGDRKWVSRYDRSAPVDGDGSDGERYVADYPDRIAQVSSDGAHLYLGGWSDLGGPLLLAYQAHDPQDPAGDGTLLWAEELGGSDRPLRSLEVAPDDSRVYVLGDGTGVSAHDAATGQRIWIFPRGAVSIAVSPAGDVVFGAGGSPGDEQLGSGEAYGTFAIGAATGKQLWEASYADFPSEAERSRARAVGVSPDGGTVYVAGGTRGFLSAPSPAGLVMGRQATVAYDAVTGEQLWVAVYGTPFHDESGVFVDVGPDGRVVTAGPLERHENAINPLGVDSVGGRFTDWGIQSYEP